MGAGTGADDATGGSQSVSATAAGPGYLCPSCRNRGSNTPSEVSFWLDISTPLFPGLTSPIHLEFTLGFSQPPRKGKKITVSTYTLPFPDHSIFKLLVHASTY